jgi:SAM-dependent methyltransferase
MLILKKLIRKVKIFIFRGDKFTCPFCGYQSNRLGRFGYSHPVIKEKQIVGSGLRRSRCYQCNSSDRERLVYAYLENEINFFESNKKSRILHISPEPHLSGYIRKNEFLEYIGGDMFTEGYYYPDFVKNMDITSIPYSDNYFDLIICNHVLEHISEDNKAMAELHRVLKPKGIAVLQVPISLVLENSFENEAINTPKLRAEYFGQYDHVRIYGQDYPQRLENEGFNVESIKELSKKYLEFGLNPKEVLYLGRKND